MTRLTDNQIECLRRMVGDAEMGPAQLREFRADADGGRIARRALSGEEGP